MDYLGIVQIIGLILGSVLTILTIHFIIFAIVGVLGYKKYPKTNNKLKYGLCIAARNEGKVIGNLIASIQNNKYPQDKLQVFVIAHNCTDNTAEIARNLGATVYEYNNPNECTKGYALKQLFDNIQQDWGISNYDAFFIFDADNILTDDYIDKMNDAFVAREGKCIITSCRNSKNFGTNIISTSYGVFFLQGCLLEFRGRTLCNCSTRVSGTGYLVNSQHLKNGWPYVTLTEDWEFSADQIAEGHKIFYCEEAMFYDEQPTNFKVMWRQRTRWSKGHLLVFLQKSTKILKNLFAPKSKGEQCKFSTYDIFINTFPLVVTMFLVLIANIILSLIAPIFTPDWLAIWSFTLKSLGLQLGGYYLSMFAIAILVFIVYRKKINPNNLNFGKKLMTCLFYPIFNLMSVPMEITAMFKNIEWKVIPHTDTTTHEDLNKNQKLDKFTPMDAIEQTKKDNIIQMQPINTTEKLDEEKAKKEIKL